MDYSKYRSQPVIDFPQRTWPNRRLSKAPAWCSVDLRDGNQSLKNPMTLEQKLAFFQFLVETGFKEIEVGFPAASDTEFQFVRNLIEQNLIPSDVTIQVLTQSREAIIRRTFEALKGVRKAVVHLYNATSPLFREVVFRKSKEEVIALAVFGAELFNTLATAYGAERFAFEYSPECFSQTEPEYALEVCNAVLTCWEGREVIINLPNTVETAMPNVHADLVEYMCTHLRNREKITVSLHAHNDRGTAVAATELCLLAGADRVEGTLFGNGERTGNADLITLALNLYAMGIDPGLDFSNIDKAIEMYTKFTALPVHPRHPYAGELVFTAFSGSHQDAIRKGMDKMKGEEEGIWSMPYLPIDPKDLGRDYAPLIRINSQSGSSSVAFVLEACYGIFIPKPMQIDFGPIVIQDSDARSTELTPEDVYTLFKETYVNLAAPLEYLNNLKEIRSGETSEVRTTIRYKEVEKSLLGQGDGVVSAFCHALAEATGLSVDIVHYSQHALESGKQARAITYIAVSLQEKEGKGGNTFFGAGVSRNVTTSQVKAIISAVNRGLA